MVKRARDGLETWPEPQPSADQLRLLAEAELIEVSVPFRREQEGWEARIFPWEPFLHAAGKSLGAKQAVTVVRHIERVGAQTSGPEGPMKRLLCVLAAPPEAQKLYSFDYELTHIVHQPELEVVTLSNPTPRELRQSVEQVRPDVVHIAGFDTWQTAELLNWPDRPDRRDGIVLAGPQPELGAMGLAGLLTGIRPPGLSAEDPDARILDEILTDAKKTPPPKLLVCNIWNSAARTAALAVAAGVGAAIGIQDTFDDAIAESFHSDFYRALRLSGHDVLDAFMVAQEALTALAHRPTGSGVVLWRAQSIAQAPRVATFEKLTAVAPSPGRRVSRKPTTREVPVAKPPDDVREVFRKEKDKIQDKGDARELIEVDIQEHQKINYSLLHNNRGLFEKFLIKNKADGILRGIEIEVTLYVGSDSFPYRRTFDLGRGAVESLHQTIRVPLTSALGRGLRDHVRTSLLVRGAWNSQVFVHDTLSVMLLPVDEWTDTAADNRWLPSFVLHRDPAIPAIIDAARKYLMVLRDDSAAGFDGYQSIDAAAEDPSETIDLQVRSIWSSLMYDTPLGYINPPPTSTRSSQRLRTPSDVLLGKQGTCIDLALLLAACLEYVDIFPVIFLLEGHCFPGYWRSEAAHEDFVAMVDTAQSPPSPSESAGAGQVTGGLGQIEPWYLDERNYGEVLELIHCGDLVPIETVWLTNRGSFWDAIDEGVKNLRSKDEFNAMIDVKRSRFDNAVTPLPIQWEQWR